MACDVHILFFKTPENYNTGRTFIPSRAAAVVTPNNIKRAVQRTDPTGARQYVIGYRRHRLLQQFTDIPS